MSFYLSLNQRNKFFQAGIFTKGIQKTTAHWMSESGSLDLFVFLGPSPKDINRQYSEITGTTSLPPISTTAYHQCRWNYVSTTDVAQVDRNMDKFDIPYDVIWLDIEYTEDKKYFTWHPHLFANSLDMLSALDLKARSVIGISPVFLKLLNMQRDSSSRLSIRISRRAIPTMFTKKLRKEIFSFMIVMAMYLKGIVGLVS
jgi:alpha-glucosidase (family GH31 glycosyl hydrolase)